MPVGWLRIVLLPCNGAHIVNKSAFDIDEVSTAAIDSVAHSLPAQLPPPETLLHRRRAYHRWMLGTSLFVLCAAFLLQMSESGTVHVAGLNFSLPPLCGSRAFFNVDCPACGLTRSFVALAAGDWQSSVRYHRLGWIIALAVIGQIPYRLLALRELRENKMVQRTWPFWLGNLLIAMLIVNWLLRLSALV
jgi:uncharacterized protein DUF2752